MFRSITGTILTRLIVAALTLAVVVMNTNFLGTEGVGILSLIILATAIIQMVYGFFGGASLAYFVPRVRLSQLAVTSACWAVVSSALVSVLLDLTGLIPPGYMMAVMGISFIQSLASGTSMVLVGKQRIRAVNLISLVQFAFLALFLLALYPFGLTPGIRLYLLGLAASQMLAFIWGAILIIPAFRDTPSGTPEGWWKAMVSYGAAAQAGNLIQLLNYRLSYYFVKTFSGMASLGIFSTGVQISEGLWIPGRSISLVQFSRISNTSDRKEAVRLTLLLARVSFLVTAFLMGILLLIPSGFYTFIFGEGFGPVRYAMMALAAGIVMFSLSVTISPYFSGTGRPMVNTWAAGAGLILTIAAGWLLVPRYGITGAGIASSVSYSVTAILQLIMFMRTEKIRFSELVFTRNDVRLLVMAIRRELFIKSPDV